MMLSNYLKEQGFEQIDSQFTSYLFSDNLFGQNTSLRQAKICMNNYRQTSEEPISKWKWSLCKSLYSGPNTVLKYWHAES